MEDIEWILLLEIQKICKNWVSNEISVESSMCSHCQIKKLKKSENEKIK